MKKKHLILTLALVAIMGIAGCGNSSGETSAETQIETQAASSESLVDAEPVTPDTETVESTQEADTSTGEDYLTANGIEITKATFEDGDFAFLNSCDVWVSRYVTFDVTETQTIITIYTLGHFVDEAAEENAITDSSGPYVGGGSVEKSSSDNFISIVDFYDSSTGENILKKADIYSIFDSGTRTLEAKDGFTVEVTGFEQSKHISNFLFGNECDFVSTTYTITHPAGYNSLVMSLTDGGINSPAFSTVSNITQEENFTSEDYMLMDKYEMYSHHPYYFTATND